MVMDPEVLDAGMDGLDAEGDEAVLEADAAGEGDTDPLDTDPVEQQWESEPIRQRREREQIRHARKLASLTERMLDGDAEARAHLAADPVGRRMLALEGRITQQVEQTAPRVAAAQRRYEELAQLQQDDPYAFTQELAQTDGLGKWFYNDYPAYIAQQQRAQTPARHRSESALEQFVEQLVADDAVKLSAAEREELDPGNPEWDGLSEAQAQAAIARRYALLAARKAAKERVAPEEARRREQARLAEAVEAGMAQDAPNVAGRPAGRRSFDEIAAAYADDPSPKNRDAYMKARTARGW